MKRVLVSRNKREGWYCGRVRGIGRHHRDGHDVHHVYALRAWKTIEAGVKR